MDTTERQVIDELFGKVRQAEAQTGPRDVAAEARIREHVAAQPAAPYYMAQAIVIQEQALAAAQSRIEELERQAAERPSGGFLGSLFGGGGGGRPTPTRRPQGGGVDPRVAAYANPHQTRPGGGFLAGAMQTAMGVAGGVLLGNALMGMFADPAEAAEEPGEEEAPEVDVGGFDEDF
jgi:hypothetical protein